jgi:transposase
MSFDPTDGHLYVFCNGNRNRLKVLFFDGSGLWVCAKRLEKGTFAWPRSDEVSIELSHAELAVLLGAIDLRGARRRRWYQEKKSQETRSAVSTTAPRSLM